jgi:hypothetical protein
MSRGKIDDPGDLPGGQPGVPVRARRAAGRLFHGGCRKPVVRQVNDAGIASSRFAQVMLYPLAQGTIVCDPSTTTTPSGTAPGPGALPAASGPG